MPETKCSENALIEVKRLRNLLSEASAHLLSRHNCDFLVDADTVALTPEAPIDEAAIRADERRKVLERIKTEIQSHQIPMDSEYYVEAMECQVLLSAFERTLRREWGMEE